MKQYQQAIPDYAEIKLNQRWVKMDTGGVLVGDIVRIIAGYSVPADVRIIEVTESVPPPSSL
jgi:magnesium-transporting ATPase (P-type)